MTIETIKNILGFAEGGAIKSVVVGGTYLTFVTNTNEGAYEYSINTKDKTLQVVDKYGTHFLEIKDISAIQMQP
jgi:hypothetical protein